MALRLTPLRDGRIEVRWPGRGPIFASLDEDPLSIFIDWGALTGHPEWNEGDERGAQFRFVPENGTLREKGHHVWLRRQLSTQSFLSHQDLKLFRDRGYLVLRGAVPPPVVTRARRAILADMRRNYDPAQYARMSAQTFAQELRDNDGGILSDLMMRSAVRPAVEALLGRVDDDRSSRMPQVAIRFPTDPRDDAVAGPPGTSGPHIDGVPTNTNGVKRFSPFTLLAGCALSDQTGAFEGNLTVYPGSHRQSHDAFRSHWRQHTAAAAATGGGGGGGGQTSFWPPEGNKTAMFPQATLNPIAPEQLLLRSGDAVLLHYMLVHCVAENRNSPDLRINCYWRMKHKELRDERPEEHTAENLWGGFDAIEEGA